VKIVDEVMDSRGVIRFYSRSDQSRAAISLVKLLEKHGWRVSYVSPDEHTAWTEAVLFHRDPLPFIEETPNV
jgi:hypothetical protein